MIKPSFTVLPKMILVTRQWSWIFRVFVTDVIFVFELPDTGHGMRECPIMMGSTNCDISFARHSEGHVPFKSNYVLGQFVDTIIAESQRINFDLLR